MTSDVIARYSGSAPVSATVQVLKDLPLRLVARYDLALADGTTAWVAGKWYAIDRGAVVASELEYLAGIGLSHTDRKSTRLNSSHVEISYAVFCLKKKKKKKIETTSNMKNTIRTSKANIRTMSREKVNQKLYFKDYYKTTILTCNIIISEL